MYEKYVKRGLDVFLSTLGLLILSWLYLLLAVIIFVDDPGPVIFRQKRIGIRKTEFICYKLRTMRRDTPHETPTHMLRNPEVYITNVGKFLRKYSLDELPQFWNIWKGDMSIVGPRPALWNQKDLIEERDKYGANNIKPGLTGLAQINGRDELTISKKAKWDGKYTAILSKGGMAALCMDIYCFCKTIFNVAEHKGVVEGRTEKRVEQREKESFCSKKNFAVSKKLLITGADSYIGSSLEMWVKTKGYDNVSIDTIDMRDTEWRKIDFSKYDVVFHVAAIVHIDMGKVTKEVKKKYYEINTKLAVETAKKAKREGVGQFIFMSSMSIYGDGAGYGKEKIITNKTIPCPTNIYGDSKWRADKGVRNLQTDDFHVAVLRPPMIYGKGSRGNYSTLEKLARTLPIFPDVNNRRSMLYIDNLCEFLYQLILSGKGGIYFPQNPEYTKTSEMVRIIAEESGHRIVISKFFNLFVRIGGLFRGRVSKSLHKAFGSMVYEMEMSRYKDMDYQKIGIKQSIQNMTRDKIE